nr:MAG TPA: Pre-T-cell antigen receptor [Caudoviricetes sp.]
MTLKCCRLADMARNGDAAGRYCTAGNGSAVPSDHFGVSSRA